MKVTARTQAVGMVLYSLPFLAVIVLSLFFEWAGNLEMIITVVALTPVVLYFLGLRWCRYVVGSISAIVVVAGLLRAIPALTMDQGRYFWLIWSSIWLPFVFSTFVSFIPLGRSMPSCIER